MGEGINDSDYDCNNVDDDFVVQLRMQNTFLLSNGLSSLVGGTPSQSAVPGGFVMRLDHGDV